MGGKDIVTKTGNVTEGWAGVRVEGRIQGSGGGMKMRCSGGGVCH